jgi:hypothetical protein
MMLFGGSWALLEYSIKKKVGKVAALDDGHWGEILRSPGRSVSQTIVFCYGEISV